MIKSKRIFFKTAVAITFMIAFLNVAAGWVGLFDPANWWFIAILGLGFPLFLFLNVLLLLFWLFINRKVAILPGLAFLLIVLKLPVVFQNNNPKEVPVFIEDQSVEVKIMSYNVRLFDLYNWSHNFKTRKQIFDFLEDNQPGIICFQEFFSSAREKMDNEKELPGVLNAPYSHIVYPITKFTTDHYGIATFSKFPIINKGVIYLDTKSSNLCIFSDIKINDDTVRIYNCHLQSVRFGLAEYKFIEDIANTGENAETYKHTKTIFGRLKTAFVKRSSQAEMIADHIQNCPYPVIVCGDFNDTALSYSYKKISQNLTDAFRESGRGFGISYAGPIPGLRIDYILHNDAIEAYGFTTHKVKLSDHFPIETRFVIKP
jgi:endonuclease/exonuclease/phosphatase family metal-dependent hydrolase